MSADARPEPRGDQVCPACGAGAGVPQLLTSMTRYFVCTACALQWQVGRNWRRETHGVPAIVVRRASATRGPLPIDPPLRRKPHALQRLAVLAGTAVLGSIVRRWLRPLRAVVAPAGTSPVIEPRAAFPSEQARLEDAADALDLLRLQDDGGPELDPGDSQPPAARPQS